MPAQHPAGLSEQPSTQGVSWTVKAQPQGTFVCSAFLYLTLQGGYCYFLGQRSEVGFTELVVTVGENAKPENHSR